MMRSLFFGLAAGLCLLSGGCESGSSSDADFIRVEGTGLVDAQGRPFEIRGTNLGHWLNPEGYIFQFDKRANSARMIHDALCQAVGEETVNRFWRRFVDSYITEEDIRYIASTGVTTVRLPFHYKLLTDEPYLGMSDAEEGFRVIDRAVEWCRRAGLRLILDMHDCPGGQTGDNIDDSYGYPWLFESEEAQALYIDIWSRVARRYADEPTILAYDLMNEPIAHYFENRDSLNRRLEPLLKRTTEAIRRYDPHHIVIFPGAQWNTRFEGVYTDYEADPNLIYSCHIYQCPPTTASLAGFVRFRDASGRPMYMGETGENTAQWVESFRKALDEVGIGWTFWTYKRLDTTRSFVGIPRPADWQTLVDFTAADRSTYAAIRENRPDMAVVRRALEEYLENCRFENCVRNPGYVSALGFRP